MLLSQMSSKERKALLQRDLEVAMSAIAITGPNGNVVEIDGPMRLAIFNAVKPLITRRYRDAVKDAMSAETKGAQMDIVEAIAQDIVDSQVSQAVDNIAKRKKP